MKREKIVIVDYGLSNLYSVESALKYCGASNIYISSKVDDITNADKLILPGVGAFKDGINALNNLALVEPIKSHVANGKILLGICLGMQLLATISEEFGVHTGMNLIAGKVLPIPVESINSERRKVPSIGWFTLTESSYASQIKNPLFDNFDYTDALYHVHSFHFVPDCESNLLATYDYQGATITAAVGTQNIYGLQFHPEKSGEVGLDLLRKFLKL